MTRPIIHQVADLHEARTRDEGVRNFVRTVVARSLAEDSSEAIDIASARWGSTSKAAEILKAAVDSSSTSGALVPDERPAATAFFRLVDQGTILGRMAVRRVPFHTRMLIGGDGAAASWVAEGKAVPVSLADFTGTSLPVRKIAALSVQSKELLASTDPVAEDALTSVLVKAVRDQMDSSFIDPDHAGVAGESPASITNAATSITSAGATAEAMREDIMDLAQNFAGDWARATIIMHPINAIALGLLQQPLGAAVLAMAGQSTLLGIRWVISGNCPSDIVALVDAGDIAVASGEGRIKSSQQGTLEMLDNPTNASLDGTATTQVSLWQNDAIALMAIREVNWSAVRAGAVVVLTSVQWGQTGSGT